MATVKILRAKRRKTPSYEYYCSVCFEEVEATINKYPYCNIKLKRIYEQDANIGKFQ